MDVRETQVSESMADSLSLGQIEGEAAVSRLDLKNAGEKQYVLKATASELIEYMNKTKWLRVSYHNYRMKKAKFWADYYPSSRSKPC